MSCELQWRCATAVVRMMKPYPNLLESVVQISCFWVGTCWNIYQPPQISFSMPTGEPKPAGSGFDRWLIDCAVGHWKSARLAFPISNNQPLPVPPPPQCGPGFDFQTKASLRTCWGHSAFSHCWMNTEFPFHRCQCLQTQSGALSSSELLNVDNFAKKQKRKACGVVGAKRSEPSLVGKGEGAYLFNPCQSCLPERSTSRPHKQCKRSGSGGILLRKDTKV